MLLEFAVKNYRSIKGEQTFSMIADASKSKLDNTFEFQPVGASEHLRLLKSAVLYGANASGKSNLIRAFNLLRNLVVQTGRLAIDDRIEFYQPFLFDEECLAQPTEIKIQFLGFDGIKHVFEIHFNDIEILFEKLDFYPNGYPSSLYVRQANGETVHQVKKGKSLKGQRIPVEIFRNQSFISKFGIDVPNSQLSPVYLYLSRILVLNALDTFRIGDLSQRVKDEISKPENLSLKTRLSKLLRIADTRIERIETKENTESDMAFPEGFPDSLRKQMLERYRQNVLAVHKLYSSNKEIGFKAIELDEESVGTNVLFAIGGTILQVLERGGLVVIDELDNSLHPKLVRFLVRLFSHPTSNPHHAQLLFATHEVTLLDREIFRKDQIWFSEKDRFGGSEYFSAGDVDGIRDDTNFELWYRTGKFGGQPKIKEIEFILGDE